MLSLLSMVAMSINGATVFSESPYQGFRSLFSNSHETFFAQKLSGAVMQIGPKTYSACDEKDGFWYRKSTLGAIFTPGKSIDRSFKITTTLTDFRNNGTSGWGDYGHITIGPWHGWINGMQWHEDYSGSMLSFRNTQNDSLANSASWDEKNIVTFDSETDTSGVLLEMSASECQTSSIAVDIDTSACPLKGLTQMTDSLSIYMINGHPLNYSVFDKNLSVGAKCIDDSLKKIGGSFRITSAYRPAQYQKRLRETWDLYKKSSKYANNPACKDRIKEITDEWNKHKTRFKPAQSSAHQLGHAFDASWSPTTVDIDSVASPCNLLRPNDADPVHFIHN